MYVNLDGIKGKVESLEVTATALEADIILVTETKQLPPKLRGYGKWISKERTEKGGGGVAITAKDDIYGRIDEINDIEIPPTQDIIWVNLEIGRNKHIKLAAYYGKQETEKISIIEEEFNSLNTQINMLKEKGEIIIGADFNAKLQIERDQYKQNITRNGRFLKKLIKQNDMKTPTLNSNKGLWTRRKEKKNIGEEKSVIDYIITSKGFENKINEILVDEEEIYKIKGKSSTDHNTLLIEVEINYEKNKTETITRWNLNNKEGWNEFNKEFPKKYRETKPTTQSDMNKLITDTMEKTIGKTIIKIGNKSKRESSYTKNLRQDMKKRKKIYEIALKNKQNDLPKKQEEYFSAYKTLKNNIKKEMKEETEKKLKKIIIKTKNNRNEIWKLKKEEERLTKENYDTIKEDGTILITPKETKEYVAEYYENLYQARDCTKEYKEITKEIEEQVKMIEEEMEKLPPVEAFTMKEMNRVIKVLKRKKAIGPDQIPNELFIEANYETKKILLKNLNKISETMEIPEEWQLGEITRLYKGKGTKGKCSNERGITLSSNYGKLYERMVNNRILELLDITEAQAGGRKGSSTVDHIILAKEIIHSAKIDKKDMEGVLLDVTKAYDKAWLTGIMQILYKRGLNNNLWTIVKRLNENLRATIQTKFGNTREIKIRDSIRQGGVLSVILYGIMMDEINKKLIEENVGINLYNDETNPKIPCLLWVDDVFLLTKDEQLEKALTTTDEITKTYHVLFGEPKSNALTIKHKRKRKEQEQVKEKNIGEIKLKEAESYKYLGYIQNSRNNDDDHIKGLKGKVEAAYQKMMAIVGNTHFNDIEMETIWTLTEACILPIITYSGEAWKTNKKNYEEANKILEGIIKRILGLPKTGTSRQALYIETGIIEPETLIKRNRINIEYRIKKGGNNMMKNILKGNHRESWMQNNSKIKNELNITEEDFLINNVETFKKTIKQKTNNKLKNKLQNEAESRSKMIYYLEGKDNWKINDRPEYMNKMNRKQTGIIFRARTRMLDIKGNFPGKYQNNICRACTLEEETQKHVLEECIELNSTAYPITKEMIFDNNIIKLQEITREIERKMSKIQNITE